jgi:hypothetical protein
MLCWGGLQRRRRSSLVSGLHTEQEKVLLSRSYSLMMSTRQIIHTGWPSLCQCLLHALNTHTHTVRAWDGTWRLLAFRQSSVCSGCMVEPLSFCLTRSYMVGCLAFRQILILLSGILAFEVQVNCSMTTVPLHWTTCHRRNDLCASLAAAPKLGHRT